MSFTWSKSKILCYRNCPFLFKLQYIDKVPAMVVEALDKGIKLHEVFDKYFDENDIYKTIQNLKLSKEFVEKYKMHIDNFMNFVDVYPIKPKLRENKLVRNNITGIVDRVDEVENGHIIIDYKTTTGTNIAEYMDELLLYAWLVQQSHQIKVIKVGIYFSANNRFVVENVTQEQIEKNYHDLQEEIKLYEDMIKDEMFEPKTGKACNWCGYKKYCPIFKIGC